MPRLTIPEPFRPAIAKLAALSEEDIQGLADALRRSSPVLNPAALLEGIAQDAKGISEKDLKEILTALIALYDVRTTHNIPLAQFVADLCEVMQRSKMLSAADCDGLKPRLSVLLELESLRIAAKAAAVQREQQRLFVDARVLTDIRPIFADDTEPPLAAVLNHSLKLSYFEDGETHDFFVVLDDEDLGKLQKTITRAQSKSKALGPVLARAQITDLTHK